MTALLPRRDAPRRETFQPQSRRERADLVPVAVTRLFDDPDARPVVVAEYSPGTGWRRPFSRRVLTVRVIDLLLEDSVTMVRVRRRLRTVEVSLLRARGR